LLSPIFGEARNALNADEIARLDDLAKAETLRFIESDVLSLRVLDPAMGSGHFLVSAVQAVANFVVDTLHESRAEDVAVSLDPQHWRRRVVERCIYGVDRNPLATELAKLSLWLITADPDKPLSFVNHRLREGDALVGAEADSLTRPPKGDAKQSRANRQVTVRQPALIECWVEQKLRDLAAKMVSLSDRETSSGADIEEKKACEHELEAERGPLRDLASYWLSSQFGLRITPELYESVALGMGEHIPAGAAATTLDLARETAKQRLFFHWQIEFPEVFLGQNPGFDVVIGNPPYGVVTPDRIGATYLSHAQQLAPALGQQLNLFKLFLPAAMARLRDGGCLGFIVPLGILGDDHAKSLRCWLLKRQIESVECFPQKDDPRNRVFAEAKLPTCVIVTRKEPAGGSVSVRTHSGRFVSPESASFKFTTDQLSALDPEDMRIPLTSQMGWDLALRLRNDPRLCPLGAVAVPHAGELKLEPGSPYLTDEVTPDLLIRGSHIMPYQLRDHQKQGQPVYVRRDVVTRNEGKPPRLSAYRNRRLIYQEAAAIGNYRRLIGTILEPGRFCTYSVSYLMSDRYDLEALAAIFNSSVTDWRYSAFSTNNHVTLLGLKSVPIPRFSRIESAPAPSMVSRWTGILDRDGPKAILDIAMDEIRAVPQTANVWPDSLHDLLTALVLRVLAMKRENPVETDSIQLQMLIDNVVNALYRLTTEEIATVNVGRRTSTVCAGT
jgi:hypothetical protein